MREERPMDEILKKKFDDTIWAAASLFSRGKLAGSAGNISFLHNGKIYISGSGTCFARLTEDSFSEVELDTGAIRGIKPSKELPLHMTLYRHRPDVGAIIHTHSFYSVLWSCMEELDGSDCIPSYTPYLKMKVGTVGLVPYAPPGSQELFEAFEACVDKSGAYLLQNHGPVVGGKDIMNAFYNLEELEESAHVAFCLNGTSARRL